MSSDPITAVFDVTGKIIDRLFPDPTQAASAKLELAKLEQSGELAEITGQMEINKVEAANPNLFVSGPRPCALWICDAALLFNYILGPYIINPLMIHFHQATIPLMDMSTLMPILLGLLGLSSFRTYERVKGVIPNGR